MMFFWCALDNYWTKVASYYNIGTRLKDARILADNSKRAGSRMDHEKDTYEARERVNTGLSKREQISTSRERANY